MKSSSNKSLTTGLLVSSLMLVGLVAWFSGAQDEFLGASATQKLRSAVPERAGTERCAEVDCPSLTCGENERLIQRPGECCARCIPVKKAGKTTLDCADIQCADCPPETQPEQIAGECCPACRAAASPACEKGRGDYDKKVGALEAELRACKTDDDCMVASYSDSCRYSCPSPVNKLALGKVVEQLRTLGNEHCGSCAESLPKCAPQVDQSLVCRAGSCAFEHETAH